MKVGDLVKWIWYLGTGTDFTLFHGIITMARFEDDGSGECIRIFDILLSHGAMTTIRADEGSLKVISAKES